MVDSTVLTKFNQRYLATRPNSGNTSTHRASSNDEIDEVDLALMKYDKSGGGFFVQARSNASETNRTGKDGVRFDLPEDGAVLGTYEVKGDMQQIVFCRDDFVNIVISSLHGRCKKPKPKKSGEVAARTTKKKKSAKFHHRDVAWAKGMITFKGGVGGSVTWANDSQVVCVWFEDSKK